MPGLARKVLICVAADGLILHPQLSKKEHRSASSVKIRYADGILVSAGHNATASAPASADATNQSLSFEAFGVVGLISVSKFRYLISITRRQHVATVCGSPIYMITEVAVTPCISHSEAQEAVERTVQSLANRQAGDPDSDDDDDDDSGSDSESDGIGATHNDPGVDSEVEPSMWPDEIGDDSAGENGDGAAVKAGSRSPSRRGAEAASASAGASQPVQKRKRNPRGHGSSNSIAEDVISRRGSYGRFAQRWFSRSGWLQEQKRMMGLTSDSQTVEEEAMDEDDPRLRSPQPRSAGGTATPPEDSAVVSLLPKLLRSTQMLFGESRAFYFSYDFDITRNLAQRQRQQYQHWPGSPQRPGRPLHEIVDPLYFWNRHVLEPFTAAGPLGEALALPLMQGFVGQCSFVVDSHPPQVDDDENVKDSVELSDLSYRSSPVGGSSPAASPPAGAAPEATMIGSFRSSAELASLAATTATSAAADGCCRPTERRFDITLISRRSVKRAGLRYLRRGVDEDGNVANAVETEQILSSSVDQPARVPSNDAVVGGHTQTQPLAVPSLSMSSLQAQLQAQSLSMPPLPPLPARTYSFVQIRGSIPLFFTQSPFSLKPVPVIQHSPEANFTALKKHFDGLRHLYGRLQGVSLVEKHGVESALGAQYEQGVQRLNDEASQASKPKDAKDAKATNEAIEFEWFDFHSACRGMKFENVSLLLNRLSHIIEEFGSTVEEGASGGNRGSTGASSINYGYGSIIQTQKGVLRTNCMDCLDRTNVCQSSFAKFMLDAQLKEQGFDMSLQHDQENAWFNTLWADNGDAISKQYASTAAMKGDYTRTRKRDYRGALTDAGLSLTRFFNGIVNDFFLQTTIDFLLGNVSDQIFDEFEANMMTKDPAMSMQTMREQAIDLCRRRVVADESEDVVGGWTLLAPHDANVSLTAPAAALEEVVLLLTDAALYVCRFDWNLDKLSSFERVDLAHVASLRLGTYIVSTVSQMQTNEARNVGFAVTYRPGRNDILRVNTRSLSSVWPGGSDGGIDGANAGAGDSNDRFDAGGDAGGDDSAEIPASGDGRSDNNGQNDQSNSSSQRVEKSSPFASFLGRRLSQPAAPTSSSPPHQASAPAPAPDSVPAKRIAFKALYADTSLVPSAAAAAAASGRGALQSEREQIETIVAEIERAVLAVQHTQPVTAAPLVVEQSDIVSLAEARKSTGLLGHLGHSLKKLVWA